MLLLDGIRGAVRCVTFLCFAQLAAISHRHREKSGLATLLVTESAAYKSGVWIQIEQQVGRLIDFAQIMFELLNGVQDDNPEVGIVSGEWR